MISCLWIADNLFMCFAHHHVVHFFFAFCMTHDFLSLDCRQPFYVLRTPPCRTFLLRFLPWGFSLLWSSCCSLWSTPLSVWDRSHLVEHMLGYSHHSCEHKCLLASLC